MERFRNKFFRDVIKSIRYLCDYIGLPCKEHSIMKNKKPSDEELLYDKNVLKLNYTQMGTKYNVDRTTARNWLSKLII